MLALRTLSITKADYISCHLIKIPQRETIWVSEGFSSATWTHALGLQHVAGGGCPLDGWPETLRGLRMLGLLSLFPSLSSCCCPAVTPPSSTLSSFPGQFICQALIAPKTCFGAQTPFCNLPSLASWLDLESPRFVRPASVMCLGEPFRSVSQGGEDPPRMWHY